MHLLNRLVGLADLLSSLSSYSQILAANSVIVVVAMPAGCFDFPSPVDDARPYLFLVEYEGILPPRNFQAYWPYIDNIWPSADTLHGFNSACTACYHRRLLTLQVWVPEGGWCPRHMMKPSRTEVL